jgi:uncharacterized protein
MTDQNRQQPYIDEVLPGRSCPICGAPTRKRTRPFCSPRCRDVDLGHWFTESYAIAQKPEADEDFGEDGQESGNREEDRHD